MTLMVPGHYLMKEDSFLMLQKSGTNPEAFLFLCCFFLLVHSEIVSDAVPWWPYKYL